MPRPSDRPYSRYSEHAALLLGQLIRQGRIARGMTTADLAARAGISRGLVQRIDKGDMGCTIGAVFEAATIVGVPLFDNDQHGLAGLVERQRDWLALLPKAVHPREVKAKDDF
jgi:transcriptional regulator with XRE-family HTH domain